MKRIFTVVDDFLPDPDAVRALALSKQYERSDYHKGQRSTERFLDLIDPRMFEELFGLEIDTWDRHGMNARFQLCTPEDLVVFHADSQTHAATIYLTPNAPVEAGLSLYKSRLTGARRAPDTNEEVDRVFAGNFYDPSKWDLVDRIGNVYNRLVLWDGAMIHAASSYFGNSAETGRLFLMFFFDAKDVALTTQFPKLAKPVTAPASTPVLIEGPVTEFTLDGRRYRAHGKFITGEFIRSCLPAEKADYVLCRRTEVGPDVIVQYFETFTAESDLTFYSGPQSALRD